MVRIGIIGILLWLLPTAAKAQGLDPAALLEERLPWADGESASEAQLEAWVQLLAHPLDLNRASYEQLAALQCIAPTQIEALLTHRERYGNLVSVYELQSVPGWDLDLIGQVLPLVQVGGEGAEGQSLWQRMAREENRYVLVRYDAGQAPKEEVDTLGPPVSMGRWLTRLRISRTRDFSVGITLEHDAGERWNRGPDYVSAHLLGQGKGWVRRWVVGDYQVHWGQGLATAAGFAPGKGGETVLSTARPARGIVPYTSSVEAGHYRGGALTLGHGHWEATVLASHVRRDATLAEGEGEPVIRAFRLDGYHRTENELGGRRVAAETTLGTMLRYASDYQRRVLGVYGLVHRWNHPWSPRVRPDNPQVFRGQTLPLVGAYGQWRWHNVVLFGEGALSDFREPAVMMGAQVHLTKVWQMAWVARYYAPGYTTVYGDAFAESSTPRNEQGLYWGVAYRPSKQWQVTAYYDRFAFPWLRFSTAQPSTGYEALLRMAWRPQRDVELTVQARREVKDRTVTEDSGTRVAEGTKDNVLVQLNFRPEHTLGLRIRAQGSRYQLTEVPTYGVALIHDVFYAWGLWKLTGRVAVFHAPDFDNRQYAYENHVLYAFALPAYYGRGIRSYVNVRVHPWPGLTVDGRLARTFTLPQTPTEPLAEPQQTMTVQVKWQF